MNRVHPAVRAAASLAPAELTDQDRIDALRSEERLLAPYASTAGLAKLRDRLAEIRAAVSRLSGFRLGDGV